MKKLFTILIILTNYLSVSGQYFYGLTQSNYNGTNSIYFNPAALADNRHLFYFNLTGFGMNISNNYLEVQLPFGAQDALKSIRNKPDTIVVSDKFLVNGSPLWSDNYLVEKINGKAKYVNFMMELRGPALMYAINHKNTIALSFREKFGIQLNSLAEPFARIARWGGLDKPQTIPLLQKLTEDNKFSLNMGAYSETGLSYAREIITKGKHYLKGGITLKYLQGHGALFFQNSGLKINFVDRDSLWAIESDVSYGLVKEQFYGIQNQGASRSDKVASDLFPKSVLGRGIGLDWGFEYEYRPDPGKTTYQMDGMTKQDRTKNKYLYKIGLSLIDMGNINYNNPDWVKYRAVRNSTPIDSGFMGQITKMKIRNTDSIDANLSRTLGITEYGTAFRWRLPATLNLNFDFKVYKFFYVSGTWMQSLRGQDVIGFRHQSMIAVNPRVEFKHFEASLPMMLADNYQRTQIGFFLRYGPLYLGSDNIGGFFGFRTINGLDFYFGLSVPIHNNKEKDRDKDGVSDRKDHCRRDPGVWELKGCPDDDQDGVANDEDKCPSIKGDRKFLGCPDTDGDGLQDALDQCPKHPGPAEKKGCPDKDNDGVFDMNDQCPDNFGPVELDGCPDSDKDGVKDINDECPNEAGPVSLGGCPDNDGDGVNDKKDKCPGIKGNPILDGCPDTDNDGIIDEKDDCPTFAGTARFNGCPDKDLDNVPDNKDRCPDVYGDPANQGCPIVKVTDNRKTADLDAIEQEILKRAFDNLEFATGKSELSEIAKASLDTLSEILVKKEQYKLYVAGHTDNQGNKAKNLQLSKDRAQSVKKYLMSKGVDEKRLTAEGYGDARPVSSNNSEKGRAKNRRVELKIFK